MFPEHIMILFQRVGIYCWRSRDSQISGDYGRSWRRRIFYFKSSLSRWRIDRLYFWNYSAQGSQIFWQRQFPGIIWKYRSWTGKTRHTVNYISTFCFSQWRSNMSQQQKSESNAGKKRVIIVGAGLVIGSFGSAPSKASYQVKVRTTTREMRKSENFCQENPSISLSHRVGKLWTKWV